MAQSSVVAWRYAKAYFDLAGEAKAIPQWRDQLASGVELVTEEQTARALANPRLRKEARLRGLHELLKDVSPQARNLLVLLVERGRLSVLPGVLDEFDRLADRASGVVRAEVVAAVPLDKHLEDSIATTLSDKLGGDVQTVVKQDPEILGGLVIRIGDRVIDTSIRTRLQQLKAALA